MMERARGSCTRRRTWYAKRQSPQRERCTEHVNQMKWTIKTAVKWDVFLFAFIEPLLAIIGHYWSLLRNYYRIVYAQMFCRTFTCNSVNSQICCWSFLTLVSLSLTRCNSLICWSSPVHGSPVAGSKPCQLSEFTPNRAS